MKKILVVTAFFFASIVSPAQAALFVLKGAAGSFAPEIEVKDMTGSASITLDIPNSLAGTRSSFSNGFVDSGIVRVSAQSQVSAGTTSIGDIKAEMEGRWEDSITFAAPGVIPSLPGVDIVLGTSGTADLIVNLSGTLNINGDNALFESAFNTRLAYGPLGTISSGSTGFISLNDTLNEEDIVLDGVSMFDLSSPPTQLILPITFSYGTAFDIGFSLSVSAKIGFSGTTPVDLFANALLDQSALWGGVENVQAMVPDGSGGMMTVSLPDSAISVTSPTFDYTTAISAVPVPAAAWLFGSGLLCLVGMARRNKTV